MIGLLFVNEWGECGRVANGQTGVELQCVGSASAAQTIRPFADGRWAEQLYTTTRVVQTQRAVFLNKGVARSQRAVSKIGIQQSRWV
jgi:hypothetical protein